MAPLPNWLKGLDHRDWLLDGRPIRGQHLLDMWDALDWTTAWMDEGPSPAGNLGPYWHVAFPPDETVHRLYPKLLGTKWLLVVRRALEEATKKTTLRGAALTASGGAP